MATVRIQLRRGTAAEWSAVNPVLAAGEMGLETDTGDFKFGDGSTAWSGLSYSLGNAIDDYIPLSEKGVADGVATLDSNGFIPVAQLPGSAALDAEVNSAISTHNSDTTNVHGISNTAELETQTGAQAKADNAQGAAITAAAADATAKANTAQSNAEATAAAALSAHESDTTGIHGIADTSILVTTTGTQTLTSKSLTSPALTGIPTAPTATAGTDTTQIATTAFVQDAIEAVVGAAPEALNTLAEIATSLNDDADLAGTLTASISEKVAKAGDTMSGALNMGDNKVTNLASPTVNTDAANKSYVDSQIQSEGSSLLQSHAAVSNNVHGITNAADLVYTQDSRLSDERTPSDNSVTEGKIADDAVTTNKIVDGAVLTDKIADIAITTAKLADGAVVTAKLADGAVTAAKISDGAVSTAKVSDESITSTKLASSAVSTDKIAGLAVTTAKINDLAVTTAKIEDLNVTEGKINTGAVTADKIGTGAVTEIKIADGSVTSAKIANGTIVNEDISTTAAIAQSKIADLTTDLAAKALDADLDAHTGATTAVHGIADTSVLATDSDVSAAQTAAEAHADSAVSTHNSDTTSVHGISDTSQLAYKNAANQTFTGNMEVDGNLVVDGDFTVNGTSFSASATSIVIEDNMVQLAHQNAANTVDLGLVVAYNDGSAKHSGIVRDVSADKWKLFKGVTSEPTTTVDFTQGSLDDLQVKNLDAVAITATGAITASSSGVVFTDGTQTKAGVPSITPITEKTANYTLSNLTERDTLIEVNHTGGTAVTITVPSDATVNFPVGTSIDILRTNTGEVTIAGSGATVNATPGLKLRAQWSSATLFKRSANTWVLFGDLKA
jgi:hypothetical protein